MLPAKAARSLPGAMHKPPFVDAALDVQRVSAAPLKSVYDTGQRSWLLNGVVARSLRTWGLVGGTGGRAAPTTGLGTICGTMREKTSVNHRNPLHCITQSDKSDRLVLA